MARRSRPGEAGGHRLPERDTELIQRDAPIHFRFAGRRYTGYAGDTVSSALWANGRHVISRSFKYHRPRADFAFDGTDPNALVQIGDEPNVRAGRRRIAENMDIRPQNVAPWLDFDLMAVNNTLHRFFPVGFYYKAFHSKRLWPFYERLLHRAAGLGKVDPDTRERHSDKRYLHADVVVVGAGPAGLSGAHAAAEAGARVLLIERDPFVGGHLRFRPGELDGQTPLENADEVITRAVEHENVKVLTDTTAMGLYDQHWLPAFTEGRLYKIRAGAVLVATGARNRTIVFTNNDLPGILNGSGAARLLNLYAVRPGEKALIVSANDDGHRLALALQDAGMEVSVAEERAQEECALASALDSAGIAPHWRHTIGAAHGKDRLQGASLLRLNADGSLPSGRHRVVSEDCDTAVLSVGYLPNAGLLYQGRARFAWDEHKRELLPTNLPHGLHTAGSVCGTHSLGATLLEGRIAGLRAAADVGIVSDKGSDKELDRPKSGRASPTTRHVSIPGPGKFRFVDFAEDVTEKDVHDALAEGYDSIELLKRYTTISMGPDQGRYGSLNAVLMTAEANRRTVEETGKPTSRPPALPVKMGTLAGRKMEPVRRTGLHHWHQRYGCHWLNAGRWARVERYSAHTPEEEVLNVRKNVGILDVSTLGKVWLRGNDVPELLSRLYTNKWRKLPIGKVRYGVMCNEEGIVSDDGVTAHMGEGRYYMTLTTGNAETVPEKILWWQQSGWDLEVHLANVTAEHAAINVAGPSSRELLARLTSGVDLSNEAFPYMSARQGAVAGVEALLLRIGFTGELSYELHFPAGHAEHVWEQLLDRGEDLGVMPFGLEAQRILRLEKGHLIVGQDTDALSSPMDAGADWVLHADKRDFIGKSALMRQRRRGASQALVGFEMEDPSTVPPEGVLVVRGGSGGEPDVEGWVTSARFSPTLQKSIGLARVSCDLGRPGSEMTVRIGGTLHRARAVEVPFYDPKGEALRR